MKYFICIILLKYADGTVLDTSAPLGGCKHTTTIDQNSDMICKRECAPGLIGRDGAINFRWIFITPGLIMGIITVKNRNLGYPAAADPYIGILRLDPEF